MEVFNGFIKKEIEERDAMLDKLAEALENAFKYYDKHFRGYDHRNSELIEGLKDVRDMEEYKSDTHKPLRRVLCSLIDTLEHQNRAFKADRELLEPTFGILESLRSVLKFEQ